MDEGSPLYIEISEDGTVWLKGELDMATVKQLEASAAETIHAGKPVVLDLAGLTFIDSSGIAFLARTFQATGERVVIRNPSRQVRRVLELMDGGAKPVAWVTHTD